MTYTHYDFKNRMDGLFKKYSSKTAITYLKDDDSMIKYSFSNIEEIIYNVGEMLQNCRIFAGDRVGIVTPHSPYGVIAGLALAYWNITMVPIDASIPIEEINKLLSFSEISGLFTTAKIKEKLDKTLILSVPCFKLDEESAAIKLFDDSVTSPNVATNSYVYKDVIAIIFSSGTTGEMKGIMITYESVIKARDVFARLSGLKDFMTYLLVLPFNHIAGFTGAMTFFLTGCELGFIENVNASKLQKGLLKFEPHYFAMVPKIYEIMEEKIRTAIQEKGKLAVVFSNAMLSISEFFRKNFGVNIGKYMFKKITGQVFGRNIFGIGTGASPCKSKTTEFFLNLGLEWANLYATTETSVPITATGIFDKYPVDTVGNVDFNPEIKIRIINSDNNGLGEIAVKSELIMKGYFKRMDLTVKAFDENGYFKTGDYGFVDKRGYLHITGRIKESIVLQSGKKVSPIDVDDYYLSRISGYDVASRGIPHSEDQYDEIHIFIEDRGYSLDKKHEIATEFERASRGAPTMYKLSGVHFVPTIPRTSVGKVKRFSLNIEKEDRIWEPEKSITVDNNSEIFEVVVSYIKSLQKSGSDFDITPDMRLQEDIGLDSLNIFELCTKLDSFFNMAFEYNLNANDTIGDIVRYINACKAQNNLNNKKEIYPKEKSESSLQWLKRWIKISKLIYKIEAYNIENIPSNGNYIICSNHASYFDPIWILAAMRNPPDLKNICCMAAIHTMNGRTSHKFFESLGGIPVDRTGNTLPSMRNASRCLKEGKILFVFPEGARSRDGSMLPFKNGAAQLAINSNSIILPVKIVGAFEIFPRWIKVPRFFDWKKLKKFKLVIKFGNPINPGGMTANELTIALKNKIAEM